MKLELVEKSGWPTEFIGPFSFVTLNTKMCFFGRLAKILGQLWMNRKGQVFFCKHSNMPRRGDKLLIMVGGEEGGILVARGRGGSFYFVRLENKNPYLGEPRWTTSSWPASS